jgi:hypothetical protein
MWTTCGKRDITAREIKLYTILMKRKRIWPVLLCERINCEYKALLKRRFKICYIGYIYIYI